MTQVSLILLKGLVLGSMNVVLACTSESYKHLRMAMPMADGRTIRESM